MKAAEFADLIGRLEGNARRYLRGEDAKDAAMNAVLAALTHDADNLTAYAVRCIHHRAIEIIRHNATRSHFPLENAWGVMCPKSQGDFGFIDSLGEWEAPFQSLSDQQKSAIVAKFNGELDGTSIANKSNLHRARARLQKFGGGAIPSRKPRRFEIHVS